MLKKVPRVARAVMVVTGLMVGLASMTVRANTLKWAGQNDIVTLDPHSQVHTTTLNIIDHIYDPLVRYDKAYVPQPALATNWQLTTPTSWRFSLRKDVKFQDGTPFTAEDVVFSINRIRQPQGTMQAYVNGVQEVRKVDDYTVDVILDRPNPTLLNNFTSVFIMSRAWAEKNKTEKVQDFKAKEANFASRNANGTGPYMLKEWVPDQRIALSANKAWWNKLDGNATEVVYTPIKSDATRVAALIAGDVDAVTDLPPQDVARLRGTSSLSVLDGPEVRTIFIGFDQGSTELLYGTKGKNPFKDLRVRQALNISIDRAAIQRTIMRGLSVPTGLMVAPGVNGYTAAADVPPVPNVEGAKKLLAEAGYPGGLEFTLDCPTNRYVNDEDICQAVANMWARIGVRVKANVMPFATFLAKLQRFDSSAYLLGWGVSTYDAQNTLQSLVRTRTTGSDGNYNLAKISNAKVDGLIDSAKTEVDKAKRDAMLREALAITRDEVLYLPLHHQMHPWAMKKNVTMVHNTNDSPKMYYVNVK